MNTFRMDWHVASLTLALGLLASGTALAQTATRQAAPPSPLVSAAAVPIPAGPEIGVSGVVVRTKQVDLRSTPDKNLVALLDLGNGQRQIVELGLAGNFRLTPVLTGEQIAVRGYHVRVGEADVLVAISASVGGKQVVIQRDTAPATVAAVARSGYPVTEQVVKIDGRVNRLRTVTLNGSRQEHLVAEIVTRGGQAIVTDLGPPEQIWRADVKQGEWIRVRGQEMKIDNRPVLLALEINKNGVPVLVDRHLVRGEPTAAIATPAPVVETAAVVPRPAVVSPPTTLVPGTTVQQTTPVEVVPPRVLPAPPVVP